MSDALDTITHLIQSPPGQLAAGGVLAGIVWKFFERVENVLNDSTKTEIARWLRMKNVETGLLSEEESNWPHTFATVFDRVFGPKHLSWKCFWRSCVASYCALTISLLIAQAHYHRAAFVGFEETGLVLYLALITNVLPDYLSLLKSRFLIGLMSRWRDSGRRIVIVVSDLILTGIIGLAGMIVAMLFLTSTVVLVALRSPPPTVPQAMRQFLGSPIMAIHTVGMGLNEPINFLWFFPAFFTSIWTALYAGSGFLLKAARRFDIGFEWFNRHFDIEKKPLQSIGLVAGALVAVVYWVAVIVSRVV